MVVTVFTVLSNFTMHSMYMRFSSFFFSWNTWALGEGNESASYDTFHLVLSSAPTWVTVTKRLPDPPRGCHYFFQFYNLLWLRCFQKQNICMRTPIAQWPSASHLSHIFFFSDHGTRKYLPFTPYLPLLRWFSIGRQNFITQGIFANVWRHCLLSKLGVLLGFSG